jgi:hypothetical protein
MSSNILPLRSTSAVGSDYASARASHWQDPEFQVIDKYKALWKKVVLNHDDGGIHFTQQYRTLPTIYQRGLEDTYGHRLRPADKLFSDP